MAVTRGAMTSPRRTGIGLWAGAVGIAFLAFFAGVFVRSCLERSTWRHLTGELWEWQTLIAGVLALIAAGLTIRETRNAADRQVRAANRQVEAAWRQTEVVSHQTEAMRTIERRRIAKETYAFLEMMDAAMASVVDDVEAARGLAEGVQHDGRSTNEAYRVRTRIRKAGFVELRSPCVRYGGREVTGKFLDIDKAIDDFALQVSTLPTAGQPMLVGANKDLHEQLERIELQANGLREETGPEIKRLIALLITT